MLLYFLILIGVYDDRSQCAVSIWPTYRWKHKPHIFYLCFREYVHGIRHTACGWRAATADFYGGTAIVTLFGFGILMAISSEPRQLRTR